MVLILILVLLSYQNAPYGLYFLVGDVVPYPT